jgi:hypothetical protein
LYKFTASTLSADNGTTISIALNAAGIAALNAALGSTIAFRGVLTTLSPPSNQCVFGFSTAVFVEDDVRRLDALLTFHLRLNARDVDIGNLLPTM